MLGKEQDKMGVGNVGGEMVPGVRPVESGQTFVQQPWYLSSG